jgi:hypothetical protein
VVFKIRRKGNKRRSAKGTTKSVVLEIADPSSLTDADWASLNALRRAYERKGSHDFSAELKKLARDPLRYVRIVGAIFPDMIRESIRDVLADKGITPDDLREIIRKREKPTRLQ